MVGRGEGGGGGGGRRGEEGGGGRRGGGLIRDRKLNIMLFFPPTVKARAPIMLTLSSCQCCFFCSTLVKS